MRDLVRDDVAHYFEPDGSLPDAYVFDAGMDDRQHVIDVVRARRWRLDHTVDGSAQPLPQQISDIFAARGDAATSLTMWPAADIAVNSGRTRTAARRRRSARAQGRRRVRLRFAGLFRLRGGGGAAWPRRKRAAGRTATTAVATTAAAVTTIGVA